MNIRLRLTLWYTAILFLILVIFSIAVYTGLSRNLFEALDAHLQREADQIIEGLEFEHAEDEHKDRKGYESQRGIEVEYIPEEGILWRILDAGGAPLIDPGYFDGAAFNPETIETNSPQLISCFAILGSFIVK